MREGCSGRMATGMAVQGNIDCCKSVESFLVAISVFMSAVGLRGGDIV